ncbi:MAG: hypothetical protein IMF04_04070 [Proteobacteria bacterium]|nr:hypothetical protein [Pseudomonadota bacterium]
MNEQNSVSISNSEIIAEWLYFAILAEHTSDSINQLIELTLASTFLEQPIISEAEIDAAIEMDLNIQKETLNKQSLSEDKFRQSANREAIKQELIEAGAGEQFEEGLAACEFLAALLGKTSDGFLEIIASYGEEFIATFHHIATLSNTEDLQTLIPNALDTVKQSKTDKNLELMGLSDEKERTSWLNYLDQLESNLTA